MKQNYFDPFGFGPRSVLFGMDVVTHPDRPRYVLPDDVPPPTGMTRQEFAAWSERVCGMVNLIPAGTVYMLGGHGTLVIRPSDVVKLQCF